MKKNGFTLIELISVIAIFSIVGIVLIPKINTAFKTTHADQLESLRENVAAASDIFLESECGLKYENELKERKTTEIYLTALVDCGLLEEKIYNPTNNELFDINKEYIIINIDEVGLKEYHLSF